MSKKINLILSFLAVLSFLTGCQSRMIPAGYLNRPGQAGKSITGSWISVSTNVDSVPGSEIKVSGELIAVQFDTVFVMTDISLLALHKSRIKTAHLYVYTNQAIYPATMGGLSFCLNIAGAIANPAYAGGFILSGLPVLISGLIFALPEIKSNSSLRYPGKALLTDFKSFARFPAGLPPGLDRNRLHLVTVAIK